MKPKLVNQIKTLILLFISGLILSGITAFPIEWQLDLANKFLSNSHWDNDFTRWMALVRKGVKETNSHYPFIPYGADWLAFAHLVIAIAFIGPLRDPVRNIWVIEFGLIACMAIFPLAFIAGNVRGIPFFWQLIDCAFGVFGGLLLWVCYRKIKLLEK
jgi:hypothetical protein